MADPKIVVKQILDNQRFKKGLKDSQSAGNQFAASIGKVGAAIGVAFSVGAIVSFAAEMSQVGVVANNVDKAFKKLGISLEDLQQATGGGVGKTKLQQMAIQAGQLGLPIKDLAKYFEFATIRAAETGQSVDFLVESIVKGIGRKSVLIMDNLGISSLRLQEEMKKTGDFGAAAGTIISEEMAKSTLSVDETVSGVDRLKTSFENLKTAVAQGNVGGMFNNMAKELSQIIDAFNSVGGNDAGLYSKGIEETAKSIAFLQQKVLESNGLKYYTDKLADAIAHMQYLQAEQKKQAELQAELDRLSEESTESVVKKTEDLKTGLDGLKQTRDELLKQSEQIALSDMADAINKQIAADKLSAVIANYEELLTLMSAKGQADEFTAVVDEFERLIDLDLDAFQESVNIVSTGFDDLSTDIDKSSKSIEHSMQRVGEAIGEAIGEFAMGEKSFKESANDLLKTIIKLIVGLLAQTVAQAFAGGASVGGPFAAATGAAAAGAAAAAFGSIVPAAMATGGTVPGGYQNDTYPALLSSGETVIPAPIPLAAGVGMQGGQVDFIIRGENLYGTWKKQQSKENRYK